MGHAQVNIPRFGILLAQVLLDLRIQRSLAVRDPLCQQPGGFVNRDQRPIFQKDLHYFSARSISASTAAVLFPFFH